MTNSRLVAIGYVVLGILSALFLEQIFLRVFDAFSLTQPLVHGPGEEWTYARFIAFAIIAAAAVVMWRMPKTHDTSIEIAAELRKVSWPTFAETRAATVAVIVASLISAALLGFFDLAWQFLTDKIQNPTL
jgi:preprotein translocase subunit SecE